MSYCLTDIHDIVILSGKEEPVVEEGQLCVGRGDGGRAGGQQPAYHGPSGDDVRTQHLVRGVDAPDDKTN